MCSAEWLSRAAEMNWAVRRGPDDPIDWGVTRCGWDGVVGIYDWSVMDGPNFTGQVDNTWDKNLQDWGTLG